MGLVAQVAGWARGHRNLPAPSRSSGPASAVTFPTTTDLACRVYLAIGADLSASPNSWVWTDITAYVRFDPGIATRQGRPDWTSTVRTSAGQLTLDNRDGRFARRNPNSPYFGSLTFNTPIWATVDAGSGPSTRMQMFVNEWPTRWQDRSGVDSFVPIQCAGIMRRLQQGSVLKSAMQRALKAANPVAFWPLEDGSDATQAASGLSGGAPLNAALSGGTPGAASTIGAGNITFGNSYPTIPGIASGPTFAGGLVVQNGIRSGVLAGPLSGMTATGFSFEFIGLNEGGSSLGMGTQVDVLCSGGTILNWVVKAPLAVGLGVPVYLEAIDASSVTIAAATSGFPDPTLPHHYRIELRQSGGDVVGNFYVDDTAYAVSVVGKTLGVPYLVALNAHHVNIDDDQMTGTIASLAFYNSTTIADHFAAMAAYAGELATTRVRRLATEEGVAMVCTSGLSSAMGAQTQDTFLDLLRECEAVDGGVLYETNWGLGFQALDDRTDQPVSLALDFDQRHIAVEPEPADDDQRLRNKWTVSRTGGSSATAEQTSGPFGTQAGGPGLYDDSTTINVNLDNQLSNQANWRLHLSTVDEDRWPSIAIRLVGTPDLIPSWSAMPFGARLTAAHPPTQVAPDTIDAVVEGWTERWDTKSWEADLATSPYSPYRIAIVDDPATGTDTPRVGSGTATLAVAINTTDTSLSVTTGAGGLWTTLAADFPLDINIGGERIRLSAIAGAASPQTFTVSARSVNGIVKSDLAGASVEVWSIAVVGL